MSRVCNITGKKAMVGNNVSHSQRKSASALKTINKKGISAVLKEARANGMELK